MGRTKPRRRRRTSSKLTSPTTGQRPRSSQRTPPPSGARTLSLCCRCLRTAKTAPAPFLDRDPVQVSLGCDLGLVKEYAGSAEQLRTLQTRNRTSLSAPSASARGYIEAWHSQ
ncbi:hypothetical protein FIBSPDRAFT_108013 [Athelia psychrophila]|uniref:Uncharacterized protein n=1 Tax=Athelia psychrophila TaxID=1759441 RepID=A0A166D7E8_9AGAM|nr:hypothetical protein FIBSPDRAFT_108013 [Fibularhizoctonia sp. CBS 109695]